MAIKAVEDQVDPRKALGDFSWVPLVDFRAFSDGDAAKRRSVGEEIIEVSSRVGFFYISNHGVPEQKVARVFAEAKRFFDQPLADKEALDSARSPTRRGYLGELKESFGRARGEQGDLKECVNLGLDYPDDIPEIASARQFYGGNQWPSNMPGWREVQLDYLEAMIDLGRRIMRAMALGLGLPEARFEPMLKYPMAALRLSHYPAQEARPMISGSPGCGEHTDYGCITLLAQDDVGGLQVETRDGRWIDAPPIPKTFVINIGDMLAFWSNGRLRSTLHRVKTPTQRSRYSLATFLRPHNDTLLTSLDGSEDRAMEVPTAGEYYMRKITQARPSA